MSPAHHRQSLADLPDIDEVPEFSDADRDCLDAVRAVLRKHGKLSTFGLTLLHQHFDLQEDEVLLETADPATRTITIRPVFAASEVMMVPAMFRMDGCTPECITFCEISETDVIF
ncbi:hypothetical protein [Verrucomicrobium spinosum]|uniref:hypothetical protein n=1 Tax=Verrucomicrobium spinosum TaxID=2736 RepID=UPI0001744C78|nr:hypothetical protein [Verrucomicrobium spinosum]